MHHVDIQLDFDLAAAKWTRSAVHEYGAGCWASKPVLGVIGSDVGLPEPVEFQEAELLPAAVIASRRQRCHVVGLLQLSRGVAAGRTAADSGCRAEPLERIVIVQARDANHVG